jgi:heme-degrading monooxygenase HmoA
MSSPFVKLRPHSTINLKTAKDAWSRRAFAPPAIPCIAAAICEARVGAVLVAGSGRVGLRRKSGMDDGDAFNRRRGEAKMFIAMNRFRVKKGSEQAFEKVWLSRDSQLNKVPGFVEFHLLKGPEHEDFTLYASHTVWQNQSAFEAWTKSEAFRAVHKDAGQNKPLYIDHPQFEGFEVRQTVRRGETAVA